MNSFHQDFILDCQNSRQLVNTRPSIRYKFHFISLIAPFLLKDLRLITISSDPSTPKKARALVKQSYLLFTWFFYLKEAKTSLTPKSTNIIRFAFLPVKRTVYTFTKAPMAHKTNSKEQMVFRFYRFTCSIKTFFRHNKGPLSIEQGLFLTLLSKNTFPVFETNLLLLKSYTLSIQAFDKKYFNLSLFLKKYSCKIQ